mmetsp:Transcript_7168/g.14943  ORF Transcript_7168/g.14943 Transcript_7168/m.14943 type:complete len:121 (+) Transcript_7168:921-1283(+)
MKTAQTSDHSRQGSQLLKSRMAPGNGAVLRTLVLDFGKCKALDLVEMGGRSSRRTRSAQSWPWVSEGHLTVFGEITPSQEKASDAVDGALKRMGANKPIISRAGVLIVARRVNMEKLWWN